MKPFLFLAFCLWAYLIGTGVVKVVGWMMNWVERAI